MKINYDEYRRLAEETCQQVFSEEYSNSLGIPLPKIDFIFPDSINYKTGEYYIKIDETFRIFFNFGLLPIRYSEFQEEVRVIVRHEIEHYMCCPFDVLTHLRMLKGIIETYNTHYHHHLIDIISLAGRIANETADIIIDTKNFRRHKSETLKSEKSWIKNSSEGAVKDLPRHNKLMFLTKEIIWKEDLGLGEEDEGLRDTVESLAEKLEKGGITNKSLFTSKTIEYTHCFFKLYEQEKQYQRQKEIENAGEADQNLPQSGQPQLIPPKGASENGSQFIFQSPDKIKDTLVQFAQEASLQQFSQILSAAGISNLSEQDKQKIWFEAHNMDIIPIIERAQLGSNDHYSYPAPWRLSDPLEDLDMTLSFSTSPVIIPGITTKKWVRNSVFNSGSEKTNMNLLLIIDYSGSMGDVNNENSNIHQAILAAYGIIRYFESINKKIAVLGFSDVPRVFDWSKDYDSVREYLLHNGSGGTKFPVLEAQRLVEESRESIVSVIITDGEIQNNIEAVSYLKEYLTDGNRLYIFLQDNKSINQNYKLLIDFGGRIVKCLSAKQMRDFVLNEIE
ncbi:MAG: VWA domain-containing protein [Ignavibacteriales bacterium]|nr:VWA domain-containing protein [Ignavibacteriales bacterium]MCF8315895.1 VWA domain-containing protein [Ignavibacteriales bacterium]MCF8437355.1 VWA domain-containing protein [Ignavibacteriales bacterium]